MQKNIYCLLFLLLCIFLLIGIMIGYEILPKASGTIDPEFKSLLISGTPINENAVLRWVSFAFGFVIVSIFLCCLFIGARENNPTIKRILWIGAILYLAVYTLMVSSWWDYTENNSFDYFLGLPIPTAWMMFGLLLSPFFLSFFYITQFDNWVYGPEDEAKFRAIMIKRNSDKHQ